ncbi:MAG TPA: mobilization protein [Porphyromonadaceae bacterium]|nr:mobilization protein [Porphyromonadaceae bacterium]
MKATKNKSQKEIVKLREKPLTNGSKSLYLDIYRDGKRVKEYLKLYLVNPKTPSDRVANKQTLLLAQEIRAKRQIEILNGEFGVASRFKQNTLFLEYFRKTCSERKGSKGSLGNWLSCLKYLESYCTEQTTLKDVTRDFVEGFRDFLGDVGRYTRERKTNALDEIKPLSQNSRACYFSKFKACIHKAFNEGLIQDNPLRGVKGLNTVETERVYLTFEEVKRLAITDCKNEVLKRAFLFSCLTGIRKSDIEKMKWEEVQQFGDYKRITFKQQKTGGMQYLDINKQAETFLGDPGEGSGLVFEGFKYGTTLLEELERWRLRAGIEKKVTFHTARHSFAVMILDLGNDLYTVSKLLGHKDIKTTQVYAKVLDKAKQEAVSMIPDLL